MLEPIVSCADLWKIYGQLDAKGRAILGQDIPVHEKIAQLAVLGCVPAVANVTLSVQPSEILMIMGLSGSGKSTLIRCLSRLVEPDHGSVRFEGIDLLNAKRSVLTEIRRRKIGMVFQDFGLMDHLSVLDNVAFPLRVQGVPLSVRHGKARAMLKLVGLEGREDARPFQLSGGQQQRVGIARSLVGGPDLWFLDEPFSALDPLIRKQMQDEFSQLQSELRKTIIFVTHDFLEAAKLGDRIVIMKDGQIVQSGSLTELLFNPVNDYVRNFVAHVPMLRVVRARDLMTPLAPHEVLGRMPTVSSASSIECLLAHFLQGAELVAVKNRDGTIVGTVQRAAVMAVVERTNRLHD
jgi:glycine betaine/proline transport system ATP-binding protein